MKLLRFWILTSSLALLCAHAALATDVSIRAQLSSAEAAIGQTVELRVTVTGASSANAPDFAVDGLVIDPAGQQSQTMMSLDGGRFTRSVTTVFTYRVVAQREGDFTIPAVKIDAGSGKVVETNPVSLHVTSAPMATVPGADSAKAQGKLAYAELIVPVEQAYVGEVIPVELRFFFSNAARFRSNGAPVLQGESFTAQKFPDARKDEVTRGGQPYVMVTFKSAITPVKAGDFTIGPAELDVTAQIPERRRGGTRLDSLFDDPFFRDNPMFGGYREQALTVRSEPVKLKVKPLPAAGRPADFGGAVGRYTMSVEAAPLKVEVGEPIQARVKISGRGNFDRVDAPKLADEKGWRVYPPTSDFQADDAVGISGTKTFEMSLIPEEKKETLAEIEFSYFDPVGERYVTLQGEKAPITVTGAPAPTPAPAAAALAEPAATPEPERDIHYIRTSAARWGRSFEPIYRSRVFWVAQGAPLAALIALVGIGFARQRRHDAPARRAAELRAAQAEARSILKNASSGGESFYDAAIRWIQLDTALATGREPETVDAADAVGLRVLPEDLAARVRSIFAAHAELRYAHAGGGEALPAATSGEVLATIRELEAHRG